MISFCLASTKTDRDYFSDTRKWEEHGTVCGGNFPSLQHSDSERINQSLIYYSILHSWTNIYC